MLRRVIILLFWFAPFVVRGQNNITLYEYWFNNDYSSKVVTSVAPVQTLNLLQGIPTTSLSNGLNIFYIRFKDGNAQYSSVVSQQFYKVSNTAGASNTIAGYEYWYDNDYANKVSQAVPLQAALNLVTGINATAVASGLHLFNIRFIDERGGWSSVTSQQFYKLNGTSSATNTIVGYEYWFDNDYANKTVQAVTPQLSLDLVTGINSNAVGNGLHVFNIRFKDERGVCNNVTTQHFYKVVPTSTSSNRIVGYEYWVDNSYGSKVAVNITPQSLIDLNTALDVSSISNGLHLFSIRFKDERGVWNSPTSQHFFKSGNVSGQPNGINGYRYWVDTNISSAVTVNSPVTTNPRFILDQINLANLDTGKHYVYLQFRDLADQWSCAIKDSFIQLGKARVDTLIPAKGGNTGEVTSVIFGTGFYQGTTVRLTRTGFPDITVPDSMMYIVQGQRIFATFDLLNRATGFWNLVVDVPGDTTMTLNNAFEIVAGVPAIVWSEIIGFNAIRPNQWQSYTVVIGNNGNVDATGVPVWISVPQDAEVEFDFLITNPYGNAFDYDTLDSYFPTDTVWQVASHSKMYCFVVHKVLAQQTYQLNFKIKVPTSSNFQLQAWVNKPLFASPYDSTSTKCLHALFSNVASTTLGIIAPGADCLYEAGDVVFTIWKDSPWGDLIGGSGTSDPSYGTPAYILDYAKSMGAMVLTCLAAVSGVGTLKTVMKRAQDINNFAIILPLCANTLKSPYQINRNNVSVVTSFDPNEKTGPQGSGLANYCGDNNTFSYVVHFENVDTATAAVQDVLILDTLDVSKFKLSTLQLGFVSFGDTIITLPIGVKHFVKDIDLRPKNNDLIVRIKGDLDDTTGILKWTFTSLDPATMLHTTNPLAGFLPPNVNEPEGEGSVFYSIKVKDSLPNNSVIANKAYIYFDTNPPIATNTYSNTIDNRKPHSSVGSMPMYTLDTVIDVNWAGIDTSSGILHYSVYYSVNNGPYQLWVEKTRDTSRLFYGKEDSTYRFYSLATDSALNVETAPVGYDAITTLHKCTAFSASITPLGPTTICSGDSVILQASIGHSYEWSNGDTTATSVIRTSSVDSVLVSDLFGCTAQSASIAITVHPAPNVSFSGINPTYCINGSPVALVGSPAGGLFSGTGITGNSFSPTNAGIGNHPITYQYTDGNGCSNDSIKAVIVHPLPVPLITANGPLAFCQGSNVILTATQGNSYLWSNSAVTQSVTINTAGTFSITLTDANGCVGTSPGITTTISPLPIVPVIIGNPAICLGQTDTLNVTNQCTGCTYTWSNSQAGPSIIVSNAGVYTATATNSCGTSNPSNNLSVTVHPLPNAIVTPAGPTTFCLGGSVVLNASPAGSYLWSTNATSSGITASNPGNYTVLVTDANGCSATSPAILVIVHSLPVANVTSSGPTTFCFGDSVVLGTGSFTGYLWSNSATTQSSTIYAAGSYSVIVTDANGCKDTSLATNVVVNALPVATITPAGSISICQGTSINLISNQAVSYQWSNTATSQSIAVNSAGTYLVKITDANGCIDTSVATVVSIDPLAVTPVITGIDTICNGDSTTLSITNPCPGCNYLWSNSGIGQSITVSLAGVYKASSSNNCGASPLSDSLVVVVNPLPAPVITPMGPTTFCTGDSVILMSSTADSFLWSTGSINQSITADTAGLYSVIVTDTNHCKGASLSISVVVNPLPPVPVISQTGSALASSSGQGNQWYFNGNLLSGETLQNYTPLQNGAYTVSVTDTNGCTSISLPFVVTFVSVNNVYDNKSIRIYPNPTPGIFTIDIRSQKSALVKIFNSLGQVVYQSESGNKQIDLSNHAKGVYLVEVQFRDGVYKEKLIVK